MVNRLASPRVMRWLGLVAVALALAGTKSVAAQNVGSPVVQVTAHGTVDQVLDQIRKMVASNGMMVMGELHQGKVIAMTGLHLQSETIFIGNPQVGKRLFSADAGVGVAVPIRLNVFQNAQGETVVSYVPPSEILKSFHNPRIDQVAQMLDGKLHGIVTMLGAS